MNQIERLEEQTELLLNSQKESKINCDEIFEKLLAKVEEILKKSPEGSKEIKQLEELQNSVAEHYELFSSEINDDIEFIEEQLSAIRSVKSEGNKEHIDEMVSELMEGEEMLEDEEFKRMLSEESAVAKQSLSEVINDIIAALDEGNIDDVAAYFAESKSMVEEDDECCDKPAKKDECCGGKYDCGSKCVCSNECGC